MVNQEDRFNALPGAEDVGHYDQSELVCELNGAQFGIPIKSVQEILPLPEILTLPQLPESLLGVCRFREAVIPVINLAYLLELPGEQAKTNEWQMVVVSESDRLCAVAVTDIKEILNFANEELEPLPSVSSLNNEVFFRGIKRIGEEVATLLNIHAIMEFCGIPRRNDLANQGYQQVVVDIEQRIGIIRVAEMRVGINIAQIERIIRVPQIQETETKHQYIKGVAVAPENDADDPDEAEFYSVIDLYQVLQQEDTDSKHSIILSSTSGKRYGFYNGGVEEIKDVRNLSIVKLPALTSTLDNDYIRQILMLDGELILLVDLDQVLSNLGLVQG